MPCGQFYETDTYVDMAEGRAFQFYARTADLWSPTEEYERREVKFRTIITRRHLGNDVGKCRKVTPELIRGRGL